MSREIMASSAALFSAVLFDMDGVIVDTEKSVTEFWQQIAASEGVTLTAEEFEEHVYGRPADYTLSVLFPGVPEGRYGDIYAKLEENNRSLSYAEIPGATSLLCSLRKNGIPMALVTGAQQWKAAEVIRQLRLDSVFDAVVSADDISAGKPDPECYLLAADRLGSGAGQCVVFEDAMSGITAAVAAEMSCIALAPERRRGQALSAGATSVIADLREVKFSSTNGSLHVGHGLSFPFPARRSKSDRANSIGSGRIGSSR